MHGFSTIIYCTKMGTNCIVNQQVTIGWNDGGAPTIGNNVWVGAGAKVLGPIFIGNDVSSQKMAIDCNLYLRCEQKF